MLHEYETMEQIITPDTSEKLTFLQSIIDGDATSIFTLQDNRKWRIIRLELLDTLTKSVKVTFEEVLP